MPRDCGNDVGGDVVIPLVLFTPPEAASDAVSLVRRE
jgi:hypothetical protein